MNKTKKVNVSFLAGLEEITGTRQMELTISNDIVKLTQFIKYMHDVVLKENPKREEILLDEKTVRPGVLVLHNNRDINLFTQAEEDDQEEQEDEEEFPFKDALVGMQFNKVKQAKKGKAEEPKKKPQSKEPKLRIEADDEITFLSIVHGG